MKKIFMLLAMVMFFPLRANAAETEIPLSECIPLEDIACWSMDAYGYPCFSLKDVCNQLDDPANSGYAEIMDKVAAATTEICGYEMYSSCGFVTEIADGLITVNQLDDPANSGYAEIMDKVAAATTEICGYEMYSSCGFVTEIADGLITVEDMDGNIWQFMGTNDWEVGDFCSMVLSDESTIEVYDDVILSYQNHGGFGR